MFIKVSLIGCGRISKRHAELLGKGHIKGAILHSVCDIDEKKAKELGITFDVPYFTNMHQMIQKTNPDLLVVLTESGNHAKHVLDIIKYKKNIIVEKPMALNVNDAEKMIEECDIAGVRLFVIKQNRFNLPIVKLRKAVDEGRFGKFVLGTTRVRWCRKHDYYDEATWRGTYKMDGGVLSNQQVIILICFYG